MERPYLLAAIIATCAVAMAADTAGPQPMMVGSRDKVYTIKAGHNVKLRCRATGSSDKNLDQRTLFFWTKVNGKNKGLVKPQKFSRFEVKQGKFLKIRNVQQEDAGEYVCSATNAFGRDFVRRTLVVVGVARRKERAKISNGSVQLTVPYSLGDAESKPVIMKPRLLVIHKAFIVGDDIRLKCVVRANPDASILWYRGAARLNASDRIETKASSGVLSVKSMRPTDAGNYTCVATNKLGSASVRFDVKALNSSRRTNPTKVTAEIGGNLTLSCHTYVSRQKGSLPRMEWRHRVPSNERRFMSPVENEVRSGKDSKRHVTMTESHKDRWKFEISTNRTLMVSFTISTNVSVKDGGTYDCYVGKPGNWRHAHAVAVRVQPGNIKPGDKLPPSAADGHQGVLLLMAIGIPVLAGSLCLAFAIVGWQCSKKSVSSPGVKNGIVREEDVGTHTKLSLCSRKGKPLEVRLTKDRVATGS